MRNVFDDILQRPLPALPLEGDKRLFIDCSTIDAGTSLEVAAAVNTSPTAGHYIDAPMSGGVVGASNGTLTFMMGAPTEVPGLVKRAEAVLSRMGSRVWKMGGPGAGLVAKLVNNYILAITNIAAAEGMNLGVHCGLDSKLLRDMVSSSTGRCWPTDVNNPVPGVVESAAASRGYTDGFGTGLMLKDLELAVTVARENGALLELASRAREIYTETEREFGAKKDFSVIYQHLSNKRPD